MIFVWNTAKRPFVHMFFYLLKSISFSLSLVFFSLSPIVTYEIYLLNLSASRIEAHWFLFWLLLLLLFSGCSSWGISCFVCLPHAPSFASSAFSAFLSLWFSSVSFLVLGNVFVVHFTFIVVCCFVVVVILSVIFAFVVIFFLLFFIISRGFFFHIWPVRFENGQHCTMNTWRNSQHK